MDYKELDRRARDLFELYNRTAFISFTLKEEDENYRLYQLVDFVLSSLPEEYRFLLEREYVQQAPRYWWQLFYSKTTYYRLKRKAITELFRRLKW
ncbi:MAG: hypothetical protein IKX74_06125 [Erysipelotrichaceae bacterium]|nr:hypothetical protein [Erysipelotrichaceae bacterium]MBO4537835.1 hypothetical protein [Erysipelotrichaceae bacterium]MBR5049197.1 hypothetical protein [Erysipelotrichaceae bacterium]